MIKITEISVRASTDIDFPNGKKLGMGQSGLFHKPGFISNTVTLSDDGLTETVVFLFDDSYDPYQDKNNTQGETRQIIEQYCAENNIKVTCTKEII